VNRQKPRILARLALYAVIVCSGLKIPIKAQEVPAAVPESPAPAVTVVTLYSGTRTANAPTSASDKSSRPPIQIVDGGVKSAGASCWQMNDKGQITTVPGNCYVLRSAQPGEQPPSPESTNAAEH
jgi:hypothetical protein